MGVTDLEGDIVGVLVGVLVGVGLGVGSREEVVGAISTKTTLRDVKLVAVPTPPVLVPLNGPLVFVVGAVALCHITRKQDPFRTPKLSGFRTS